MTLLLTAPSNLFLLHIWKIPIYMKFMLSQAPVTAPYCCSPCFLRRSQPRSLSSSSPCSWYYYCNMWPVSHPGLSLPWPLTSMSFSCHPPQGPFSYFTSSPELVTRNWCLSGLCFQCPICADDFALCPKYGHHDSSSHTRDTTPASYPTFPLLLTCLQWNPNSQWPCTCTCTTAGKHGLPYIMLASQAASTPLLF